MPAALPLTTTQAAVTTSSVARGPDDALRWSRPRSSERQHERDVMVEQQIARGGLFRNAVKDPRVLAALRAVPRHEFVPADRQDSAYADTPLPIGYGQTISQPYIVAVMTELLQVQAGDKVLEIGTGSGYQAAVLSELTPFVYTMEIIEPLLAQAAQRFERLGYQTIQARVGDGYEGWSVQAPFDGIIVTCAAGHVPPPLWEQLKPGGRMVIPIGAAYETQRLLALTKQADGGRESRSVLPVAFVPMTGKVQQQ
jgi:protein-L-isoaspartate(D-aspartate) O-methyltransferase